MAGSVIVDGLTKAAAALHFVISAKTVAKWVKRSARQASMDRDRSTRPLSCQAKPCLPHAPKV